MLRCRKILTILIFLSILASTISSHAEEEVEDLIDIAESNSKIIAIVETIKVTSSKATVRTSDRLLTFEAKDSNWNEHRLY